MNRKIIYVDNNVIYVNFFDKSIEEKKETIIPVAHMETKKLVGLFKNFFTNHSVITILRWCYDIMYLLLKFRA